MWWRPRARGLARVLIALLVLAPVLGRGGSGSGRATPAWGVRSRAIAHIAGYASKVSVRPGERIGFSVSDDASTFSAEIFRLGWYRGAGARKVMAIPPRASHRYPVPSPDPVTGLVDANWPVAFSIAVPASWSTGVYLVRLTNSGKRQSLIPFVVRALRPGARLLFVRSVSTDQAYNRWGGASLYKGPTLRLGVARATKVSFNRPFAQADGAGSILTWEYPMVRFLEREGIGVDYVTDVDIDRDPGVLLRYRGIVVAGHSEYWTGRVRDAFEHAVASGVNLAVFGADAAYWQVRYEGPDHRVMVCYKDASLDPVTGSGATVRFRDPPVNRPESMLIGAMYAGMTPGMSPWIVVDSQSWVFGGQAYPGRGIDGLVGDEFDKVQSGYPLPAGLQVLTGSPAQTPYGPMATGSDRSAYVDVSNATTYIAPSGAQVLNVGALNWAWGVDDFADPRFLDDLAQTITRTVLLRFAA